MRGEYKFWEWQAIIELIGYSLQLRASDARRTHLNSFVL